jgi:hypothetical protein
MSGNCRWVLLVAVVLFLSMGRPAAAITDAVKLDSSTQFLSGDDQLGEGQAVLAQYLRLNIKPENRDILITGYGRVWKDFSSGGVRDDDLLGRLYYLYVDYRASDRLSLRLGRQFVNFSAGSSILDGASVELEGIGPIGVTLAGGSDVRYLLDSEESDFDDSVFGVDIHLSGFRSTQLGLSYVMRFDEWDRAREEFGLSFRRYFKDLSPYAEVRYDRLSEAVDEATLGLDVFPTTDLMLKGEFYHSYPTFDSTSIYSVFAVDKYREYLIRAEYSISAPVTVFASYARQTYEDDDDANRYEVGARFRPMQRLTLNASVDYREGFGGKDWGFEAYGDYRIGEKFLVSAGAQHDTYKRPEDTGDQYAQRYWVGGQWHISKDASLLARVEDNVNENFNHRPLGRVALNWNL